MIKLSTLTSTWDVTFSFLTDIALVFSHLLSSSISSIPDQTSLLSKRFVQSNQLSAPFFLWTLPKLETSFSDFDHSSKLPSASNCTPLLPLHPYDCWTSIETSHIVASVFTLIQLLTLLTSLEHAIVSSQKVLCRPVFSPLSYTYHEYLPRNLFDLWIILLLQNRRH